MSENGNAVALRVMLLVGPVAALIVGIVIGTYSAQAALADKYETQAGHDRDVQRIEDTLKDINRKLDRLIEREH